MSSFASPPESFPPAPSFNPGSSQPSPGSSPPESLPPAPSFNPSASPPESFPPSPSFNPGFSQPFPLLSSGSSPPVGLIIGVVVGAIVLLVVCLGACGLLRYAKSKAKKANAIGDEESQSIQPAMVQFLDDIEREKIIRFTPQELVTATNNFAIILGSGGFGIVYKGIIDNNPVAVKVLSSTSNQQIEKQFMAEVSTMGRTHHFNLVRLYGFCFEPSFTALVYEFMVNGSLDNHLFKANEGAMIGFDKLYEIALGTARGLRDNTHITMTGGRGTPGYAAPELWMPLPVTHKCDVYSFGMLLFEIIGRRKNMDITLGDSQQWFPVCAWGKYEKNQLKELMIDCEIEDKDHEIVERMLKVAFCCVQYRPETRPAMSIVVKMLEGVVEVPGPLNPFTHFFSGGNEPSGFSNRIMLSVGGSDWSSSEVGTSSMKL
ncbi:hypothetical protein M8C21_016236 [Ambrosia artemisiifolia]|uniref:Protein kinase domain-containing protein n=1 Tax=Ambrosia artemisiifolia TaxID=4212 RepID=A0AAD5GM09_AMBAR|nr:hypothetical protein M8C21_016236 [Ambrosia artemisiifolia]